jgi:DNA-binding NtrC family response regulator
VIERTATVKERGEAPALRRRRKPTILIVEDNPDDIQLMRALVEGDYRTEVAETGEEALRYLARESVDVLLLDIGLGSGISGIDVLKDVKPDYPYLPAIMITEHRDFEEVKSSMKLGADDFVLKDEIADPEKGLLASLRKTVEARKGQSPESPVRIDIEGRVDPLIAMDPWMLSTLDRIDSIAETDCNVLITGETGTGKELIARLIHQRSSRAGEPFFALNCATPHEQLMESQLFGHVKGAYTGADRDREGMFSRATSGTLLLDEIGDMAPATQAKVLRVLEDREFERLGDNRILRTDARFIAATNRDLQRMIEAGKFRADLYYRIKVAEINVPPLRMRQMDIEPLARHFVISISRMLGREIDGIEPRLLQAFRDMRWPGNVRELRSTIARSLATARGPVLEMCDVFTPGTLGIPRGINLEDAKRRAAELAEETLLRSVLSDTNGNVSRTAEILQTSRQNVHTKMKKYDIDIEKVREK